ncbi:helix-turn-helix transcriptional regulator, partial [Enterococcus sp. 12E11_DIV0728]
MFFQVDDNKKEVTRHVTKKIPLGIYHRTLMKERHDTITLHWHEEFQLVWVFSGTLLYRVEGEEFQLQQNEGLLINTSKIHGAIPATALVEYICIDFSPQFINEEIYELTIAEYTKKTSFAYMFLSTNTRNLEILSTLKKDMEDINYLGIYELLISSLNDIDKNQATTSKHEEVVIYQLLDYVHNNYQKPIKVQDIAQSIPISKKTCTNLFNSYTKLSPNNYLIDYRLNQAKKMLLETELDVAEICFAIGFNNISYFITRFKNKY